VIACSQRCGIGARLAVLFATIVFVPHTLRAQLTTGIVAGVLHDSDGHAKPDSPIVITGEAGFRTTIRTAAGGEFFVVLPYGQYSFAGVRVWVAPLQTTGLDLVTGQSGVFRARDTDRSDAGVWPDTSRGNVYPDASSVQGTLLSREASSVTEPLDFAGLSDNRAALESQRGVSWTATHYSLQGMDATDSYQPGAAAILPDVQALDAVVVRSGFAQTASSSAGTDVGLFLAEPGESWHGEISNSGTAAALASSNLPAPAARGLVQQADEFHWLTRDGMQIGGPVTKWADFFASAAGQWSSQTIPLAAPGTDQQSRILFGNLRSRMRAGPRDQFDAEYSGSRLDLSGGGVPAGLEALAGFRMAPSFVLPGGFQNEAESDRFDFLQAGWTRQLPASTGAGAIEVRYGYSSANLDTGGAGESTPPSRIELLGGSVTGAPPLANQAVRERQQIAGTWQPGVLHAAAARHQILVGGGWTDSSARNRFTTPSDTDLITADGVPAFVMEFNTPDDSREIVRAFSGEAVDHLRLMRGLSVDLGGVVDFSRGSLPPQSSPGGTFTPARTFAARPDLIVWNSFSPRAGFAWQVPHARGLVLRGAYARLYAPLAGRYLDFGNPNSLGGLEYQWTAANANNGFLPDERGALVERFGGPYSSISPALQRPYSDNISLGMAVPLLRRSVASAYLFRRDDKNRIAAIDTGVPAQAFTPVSILDPGPDGLPGTFDDQRLTVYAQNPATLGQDRYLLTNPPGLRMLNTGVVADAGTEWRSMTLHASFVAEKSYGPTNPGDAVFENDAGVIGALFLDPNTAIHADGRSYVDRAYVGKMQATYRLPSSWGGLELANAVDYMDGLVFARELLVTGLPQGPFLVATTARGSPGGGNRAEYVVNWNFRLSREFELPVGRFRASADVLNVTNAAQRLEESDLSGPSFNLRLPVSIQPPRFVRIGLRYEF
jgi:hypothetical protein